MFSFTCSFVNQNIFGLNKKFSYRIMVRLQEHGGLPFSDVSLESRRAEQQTLGPPRGGKSFCQPLRHIYGIRGITKFCSEGAGNSISHPTSVWEFLRSLLATLTTSLLYSEERGQPGPSLFVIPAFASGHWDALCTSQCKTSFPWTSRRQQMLLGRW